MKNKSKLPIVVILLFTITLNLSLITNIALATDVSSSNLKSNNENSQLPAISGQAALTMDLSTGEVIYAKNASKISFPASITKLMTALIFAENANPSDKIPVTAESKAQPPYSLDKNYGPLEIGDSLSGEEIMDALLLYSANDSAYMIADYVSKNASDFIKLMNDKAKELGMKDTNFVTANGLHDENHYTTAYDLSLLGKAAYANPWVKKILSKKTATIEFSESKKRIILYSSNKDLGKDGNVGGKTGFTSQAGRCLLSIYERDGRTILGVVLGSEYGVDDNIVFKDMNTIINYSFSAEKELFKKSNDVLDKVNMKYKAFGFFGKENTIAVPILLSEDINYYNNSFNNTNSELVLNLKESSPWKLSLGSNLKVNFKDSYNITEYSAKADISILKLLGQNIFYYLLTIGGTIILIIVIIFTIRHINKTKRRKAIFNRRKILK